MNGVYIGTGWAVSKDVATHSLGVGTYIHWLHY